MPGMIAPEARSWVSHLGAGAQALGPIFHCLSGCKQGAILEEEQLPQKLAPIWGCQNFRQRFNVLHRDSSPIPISLLTFSRIVGVLSYFLCGFSQLNCLFCDGAQHVIYFCKCFKVEETSEVAGHRGPAFLTVGIGTCPASSGFLVPWQSEHCWEAREKLVGSSIFHPFSWGQG